MYYKAIILLATALIVFSIVAMPAMAQTSAAISYGTDREVYNRGDTVNGYVEIKNTGNTVINGGTVKVSVSRNMPFVGALTLGSKDIAFSNLNIPPGGTLRKEFSETIPAAFAGFSTAGKYHVSATVTLDGTNVGTFTRDVEIR